ncbi:MAG: type III-B CRISPR module RAMP protein Cmr1, partial [Planctomycetota bacterium]
MRRSDWDATSWETQMVRAEIDLKAVTPAFIHVEPRGVAEFRVSSLRGMLRYWTRALWGAHASNLQELFKRESDLWGRTDRSSRVRIWSKNGLPKSDASSSLLPHYRDQRASRS